MVSKKRKDVSRGAFIVRTPSALGPVVPSGCGLPTQPIKRLETFRAHSDDWFRNPRYCHISILLTTFRREILIITQISSDGLVELAYFATIAEC